MENFHKRVFLYIILLIICPVECTIIFKTNYNKKKRDEKIELTKEMNKE